MHTRAAVLVVGLVISGAVASTQAPVSAAAAMGSQPDPRPDACRPIVDPWSRWLSESGIVEVSGAVMSGQVGCTLWAAILDPTNASYAAQCIAEFPGLPLKC